jgi:hypothetical protein
VRALPPAAHAPPRPGDSATDSEVFDWARTVAVPWADAMDAAMVERFGLWASGWRWAMESGDVGGGPVRPWCCPLHSVTTPAETLARVAAALVDWREWLEELAARFDRFLPLPPDAPLDVWERAVAHLVTVVVERTDADDAWYEHCAQVLEWFLTAAGVPGDNHRALVEAAIGGQFESWIGPPEPTIIAVAVRLARDVRDRRPDA